MKIRILLLAALLAGTGMYAEEAEYPLAEYSAGLVFHPVTKNPGHFAETTEIDGKPVLRIDFNCSGPMKHAEFTFAAKKQPQLQEKMKRFAVELRVFIPEDNRLSRLGLRIMDQDREIFQYLIPIVPEKRGWTTLRCEIDATVPQKSCWGGGEKADKKLDWPLRLIGFALIFATDQGTGYLAFESLKVIQVQ